MVRSAASGGMIVQFLYGEDGMDAVWIERQNFDSLTLAKVEFEEKYAMNTADADFGYDEQNISLSPSRRHRQMSR
jgi:DNA-directed RNA polymerase II subunit RPB1